MMANMDDLVAAEISLHNMKKNLRNRVGHQRAMAVELDAEIIVTGIG